MKEITMNKSYFYLDMKTHELEVPFTGRNRRVRVLLPKGYAEDTERTYPVVYFHDGQNVLYSKESFSGHSWKVIPTIKRNPDISKMIVVAIDNDGMERMHEYAAWKYSETSIPGVQFGGKGTLYAEFVMDVVKPFIDKEYRTKSDKAHTAMIGSSLGGNITQFMGLAYQDQIGCLGVFSSANWLHQDAFDRFIERKKLDPSQRVYIYVGTEEADDTDKTLMAGNIKQAYINSSLTYFRQLIAGGVHLHNLELEVISGAVHNEEAWALYLPDCLRFLSEHWS
jgi:predicted alpha/beta superfamily hydrolase